MSKPTFVLVPGAGSSAWYWHRVVPLLAAAGRSAVAVDPHGEDPDRGLPEYATTVRAAMDGLDGVVLLGQSMGAFTVPMAAAPPVVGIVLLNAMIPLPGETPGDWWEATGQPAAMAAADAAAGRTGGFDVETHFLHDVPAVVLADSDAQAPAGTPFGQPCEFTAWPDVPIAAFGGRDDRFFPIEFQRALVRERLGLTLTELPGGHLNALSEPAAVAEALLQF